jgi:hypothetical protein
MTAYADLIDLVRAKVSLPDPVGAGDDYLSDANIGNYLNNAFDQMVNAIKGIAAYVEFTLTAGGVIAVTKPVASPPSVTAYTEIGTRTFYRVSNALSYESFENLTDPIYRTDMRVIRHRPLRDVNMQGEYANAGGTWIRWFSIDNERGFTLQPAIITDTNTIGIHYRKNFTRSGVGAITQAVGTGLNDVSVKGVFSGAVGVNYAVKIVAGGATNPNTFTLSADNGVTYGGTYNCATTGTSIGSGLSVVMASLTGHTANDVFKFTATIPDLTPFSELEMRAFPVTAAASQVCHDIGDDRANLYYVKAYGPLYQAKGIYGGEMLEFLEKRQSVDRTDDMSTERDPLFSSWTEF